MTQPDQSVTLRRLVDAVGAAIRAAPWHAPGIGGLVYNPPDIIHATRATTAPLLAIWSLWAGTP